MRGKTHCVDGRLMRSDPQPDDPYLQTDRGVCPDCDGRGCEPPSIIEFSSNGATVFLSFDKPLTAEELRDFHEYVKEWTP